MTKTMMDFYREHGVMSDPGPHLSMLRDLPADPRSLRLTVQNCLVHLHWLAAYGLTQTDQSWREAGLRSMNEKLRHLREAGYKNLNTQTTYNKHLTGTCRDFSVFLCSLLRHKKIPARPRCGFASYFEPGKYIDHWICEYWDGAQGRWIMTDAQLDELQCERLHIGFDPADIPEAQFVFGGKAWLQCREHKINPSLFGMLDWWGIDYVKSNFLLDIGALNKMPMLPWDFWAGVKAKETKDLTEEELAHLDKLAVLSLNTDQNHDTIRLIYEKPGFIRVPDDLSKVWAPEGMIT
jgi:hypothetical protein